MMIRYLVLMCFFLCSNGAEQKVLKLKIGWDESAVDLPKTTSKRQSVTKNVIDMVNSRTMKHLNLGIQVVAEELLMNVVTNHETVLKTYYQRLRSEVMKGKKYDFYILWTGSPNFHQEREYHGADKPCTEDSFSLLTLLNGTKPIPWTEERMAQSVLRTILYKFGITAEKGGKCDCRQSDKKCVFNDAPPGKGKRLLLNPPECAAGIIDSLSLSCLNVTTVNPSDSMMPICDNHVPEKGEKSCDCDCKRKVCDKQICKLKPDLTPTTDEGLPEWVKWSLVGLVSCIVIVLVFVIIGISVVKSKTLSRRYSVPLNSSSSGGRDSNKSLSENSRVMGAAKSISQQSLTKHHVGNSGATTQFFD